MGVKKFTRGTKINVFFLGQEEAARNGGKKKATKTSRSLKE